MASRKVTGLLGGDGKDRPRAVRVTTLPVRGSRLGAEPPPGQLDCSVDPKGRFVCELPAATYDLHVAPIPFVPAYLAGVRVDPAGRLDLGTIPLRRGASVAGWVAVEGARFEPSKTHVRLRPATITGAPPDPRRAAQEESATFEAATRADGFFQFVGVPPGSWELEAEQTPLAPARKSDLRVEPESETVVPEPLILRPKEALALRVEPPLDWSGRRWKVSVRRRVEGTERLEPESTFEGAADEEGVVRIASAPPGRFLVSVEDARGQNFFSDLRFELTAGDEKLIRIRWVDVKGRVRLGDQPLAARLWFSFGGRKMAGEPIESDGEGLFNLVLPFEGRWPVEIESAESGVRAQVEANVEADRDRQANLDLRLPDTRLFGGVSFDGGKPAPNAMVFISAKDGGTGDFLATADGEGAFSFRGLPAGRLAISAELREDEGVWSAPAATIPVADGEEAGPLQLVLRRRVKQTGRVMSPRGPVAGAVISAWPLSGASGSWAKAGSDIDGTFTFDSPVGSGPLVIVPRAPGFALRAFVRPSGTEPIVLDLSPEAGSLEVALPWMSDRSSMGFALAFFEDGIAIPYGNLLARWAMSEGVESKSSAEGGTSIRVPALAPGRWDVCLLASHDLAFRFANGDGAPQTGCVGGALEAGATLRLEVPKPAAIER
ncbi:MAG: carboxypeptidase-like regulatory domain-containing protein [Acidobacteriota bacterium]